MKVDGLLHFRCVQDHHMLINPYSVETSEFLCECHQVHSFAYCCVCFCSWTVYWNRCLQMLTSLSWYQSHALSHSIMHLVSEGSFGWRKRKVHILGHFLPHVEMLHKHFKVKRYTCFQHCHLDLINGASHLHFQLHMPT